MPRYEGRLELTWTNKHERLLAHEDGSYEWLPPSDYRVAEVRLLHDVAAVGEVNDTRAANNLLIRGDALHALTSLARLPEFEREYVGKVKLAYIDPPFNTGQAFTHYDDALEHSVWLTMMRDRLTQIQGLLSDDGSLWVHLDDEEVHRARLVLDEVFGVENYVTTVVWEKTTSSRNDAQFFSTDQDYILVYAKDKAQLRLNRLGRDLAGDKAYRNPDNDPRGPWREIDYKGPKSAEERPNLYYSLINPFTGQEVWPRRERVWAFGRPEYERHVAEGLLWWGKTGSYRFPKLKKYLSSADPTSVPRTLWFASEVDTTRRAKDEIKALFPDVVPFATPKPEKLLQRIIRIATEPGEIVLDCFAGSGTTPAVAHKEGRRWVAIERSEDTVARFASPRLEMVVRGEDLGGVTTVDVPSEAGLPEGMQPGQAKAAANVLTKLLKAGALVDSGLDAKTVTTVAASLRLADKMTTESVWDQGGGFRVLAVSESMFVSDDAGMVFLADSLGNGALAEATAAQLRYEYKPEPPFAGIKGRTRLAVVDGVVNEGVVRLLVSALDDEERIVICGTGLDPDARGILRDLRPGSTLRKVPAALLERYRATLRRDRRAVAERRAASLEGLDPGTAGLPAPAAVKAPVS